MNQPTFSLNPQKKLTVVKWIRRIRRTPDYTVLQKYHLVHTLLFQFRTFFHPIEFWVYYRKLFVTTIRTPIPAQPSTKTPQELPRLLRYILANKKNNKSVHVLHFFFTKKNTIVHLTDLRNRKVHKQWSTKSLKKLEMRKNTRYNIKLMAKDIVQYLKKHRQYLLAITIQGSSFGSRFMLRRFNKPYFYFFFIRKNNHRPLNGCRQKKKKRK